MQPCRTWMPSAAFSDELRCSVGVSSRRVHVSFDWSVQSSWSWNESMMIPFDTIYSRLLLHAYTYAHAETKVFRQPFRQKRICVDEFWLQYASLFISQLPGARHFIGPYAWRPWSKRWRYIVRPISCPVVVQKVGTKPRWGPCCRTSLKICTDADRYLCSPHTKICNSHVACNGCNGSSRSSRVLLSDHLCHLLAFSSSSAQGKCGPN